MTNGAFSLEDLPDAQLLEQLTQLAQGERRATANLIRCLAEVDRRRLYLSQGCPSLFVYCTRMLCLSEHAAYARIEAARAARRFPQIVPLLEAGSITLTTVTLLKPVLTEHNVTATLAVSKHKTKREVEELAAGLRPKADVPPTIRKLPDRRESRPSEAGAASMVGAGDPSTPAENALVDDRVTVSASVPIKPLSTVAPLAPERYKMSLTLSRETYEKIRRAQDLLRHAIPNGDLAAVLDRALTLLLKDLERSKCGQSIVHIRAHEH